MLTNPASYMILNAGNVDDLESLKKSILNLGGVAVLSSEEQKMVKGGVAAAYSCACNDGSAVWTGNYSGDGYAAVRAAHWCEGGGTCWRANQN